MSGGNNGLYQKSTRRTRHEWTLHWLSFKHHYDYFYSSDLDIGECDCQASGTEDGPSYRSNNRFKWGHIVVQKNLFQKLSHLVPAIIIYYSAYIFSPYQAIIEKSAMTYMIVIMITVLNALLNVFDDIYRTYEVSKIRPIKSYIQVAKIVLFIIGGIIVISSLIGQNPLIILSGLGALSAVLMLVFKDSILGLVAGVQLSSNDMVRVGDWIEMPKYNADGDVIDITLNTVKVMNFDKTITMIPSYALISDSFRNWRGMQVSGRQKN